MGNTELNELHTMKSKKPHRIVARVLISITATFVILTAGPAVSAGASTRLAELVGFTLDIGKNASISRTNAGALGLGDQKIPIKELVLSKADDPLAHGFGVSLTNTNDVLFVRFSKSDRSGIIWLTAPNGRLRMTLLTATNRAPTTVTNSDYSADFEREIKLFLEQAKASEWNKAPYPLHAAAKYGDILDVAVMLKRHPKALNERDDEGMTPLAGAIVQEHGAIERYLLEKGADVTVRDNNGGSPLELAASREKTNGVTLCEPLLAKGAKVNSLGPGPIRISALDWAVTADNTELVGLLLEHGAFVGAKDRNGDTPLHTAADRGDPEIAEMLIAHGANVNAVILGGTTPLHNAAWSGRDDVVEILISKGADVDPKRSDGLTPLISAADREHNSTVEILLAHHAQVNAATDDGSTALLCATARGNVEIVQTLLAHGADFGLKNKKGETALQLAVRLKQSDIAELLRQHGARE